jgi:hypothetical protein
MGYYHQADKGGHFAAWEQPDLFATEIRAAFRSLRKHRGLSASGPAGYASAVVVARVA